MNIAFILPSLANKGPVLVVKEIVSYLVKKDIPCIVYYFDNITDISMSCPTKQIGILDPIDFDKYDIIHCHLLRPDGWAFRWSFRKGVKKKLITTIHNYFKDDLRFSYSKPKALVGGILWRLFWSRFTRLVLLTESARKYYSRYIPSHKMDVVYNGRTTSKEDIPEEDFEVFKRLKDKGYTIIGTVASFNARKGLEQIIKFLPDQPQYSFIIIGDGPEKENLLNLARTLSVDKRVYFMGPRAHGFRYNRHFDIFAIPSRAEGVPLALLEAVSSKVPVLCSNIDVFKEVLSEDEAFFFELDNISSIGSALARLRLEGSTYAEKAYQRYLTLYTTAAMSERYIAIYRKMIDNN